MEVVVVSAMDLVGVEVVVNTVGGVAIIDAVALVAAMDVLGVESSMNRVDVIITKGVVDLYPRWMGSVWKPRWFLSVN